MKNITLIIINFKQTKKWLLHKKNVLVHCFEGKHRSAAVVEYLLMKRKFGFDYKKAFDFIKKKRHVAFIPQDFFRDFLLNYNQ